MIIFNIGLVLAVVLFLLTLVIFNSKSKKDLFLVYGAGSVILVLIVSVVV